MPEPTMAFDPDQVYGAIADGVIDTYGLDPHRRDQLMGLIRDATEGRTSGETVAEALESWRELDDINDLGFPGLDPGQVAEIAAARELAKFWYRRIGWGSLALVVAVMAVRKARK